MYGHTFGDQHHSSVIRLTKGLEGPFLLLHCISGCGIQKLNTHKFFFWLMLRDRLNTRAMLQRKNMHLDSYCGVLCVVNIEEDIMHLFFECPFSSAC